MNSHPEMSAQKAYAAALVTVILYIAHGLMTGEWVSVSSLAPALTVVLTPLVVWGIPNHLLHDGE